MNVIRHAANSLRMRVQPIDDASEIGMKLVPPFLGKNRLAVFRGEDEMVVQAGMSGRHGRRWLAPLPGC